jgi:hypothetical protein
MSFFGLVDVATFDRPKTSMGRDGDLTASSENLLDNVDNSVCMDLFLIKGVKTKKDHH